MLFARENVRAVVTHTHFAAILSRKCGRAYGTSCRRGSIHAHALYVADPITAGHAKGNRESAVFSPPAERC